jgi:hypothetical protein
MSLTQVNKLIIVGLYVRARSPRLFLQNYQLFHIPPPPQHTPLSFILTTNYSNLHVIQNFNSVVSHLRAYYVGGADSREGTESVQLHIGRASQDRDE